MNKADFVQLAKVNAHDCQRTNWNDFLDFAPLPPFGTLSSDMSRKFMRGYGGSR